MGLDKQPGTAYFPRHQVFLCYESASMNLETNKIIGAIVLALLIASVAGFVARESMEPEALDKPAYPVDQLKIATAAPTTAAPAAAVIDPIDGLLAAADVAAGQKVAKQCLACHTFEKGAQAKVGPNLWGIVGNVHAHMEGFSYSDAMKALHDKKWTYDELNHFLYNPKAYISGTKMALAGVRDTKDRANLVAWLRTLADTPEPLPAGK